MLPQIVLLPPLGHKEAIGTLGYPIASKLGDQLGLGHSSVDKQTHTRLYNIDLLIMSSSEKVLLKPIFFQTWPLFNQKGLGCPDSIFVQIRGRPGRPNRHMVLESTFQFRIKQDIFYRFSLTGIYSKFNLFYNKLRFPCLNLII